MERHDDYRSTFYEPMWFIVNVLTPHLVTDSTALLETFFLCVCSIYYLLASESLFVDVEVTTGWHRPHPKPPSLLAPNSFPQKQASKEGEEIII